MPKKKKKAAARRDLGISDAIRAEIAKLSEEELVSLKTSELLERLAEQGVTVTPSVRSRASTLLTRARRETQARGKKRPAKAGPKRTGIENLEPAMEYVAKCGGFQPARAALDALEDLVGTIDRFKERLQA